jgi:FixJ family two-component response regulator
MDPLFIVVIDDDQSVCKALRRLLRAALMEVETYASGQAFLDVVLKRDPDCLILDIRMPGLTGPDLRDRLQEMGRRIPIVFITAHAEDVLTERSLNADGADVLRKPFGDRELLDAITRTVRKSARGNKSGFRSIVRYRTKGP